MPQKPTIEIVATSMTGNSLFIISIPGNKLPLLSATMPTEVAFWLKNAADNSDKAPQDFMPRALLSKNHNEPDNAHQR